MASLSSRWSKPQKQGISERLNNVIKPKGALKPRIETAIKKLQTQTSKLDNMLSSLDSRNEKVFHRIVEATQQHDTHTAKSLSKELAEIRKVRRVLGNARMAIEQIELRLTTFHDLGRHSSNCNANHRTHEKHEIVTSQVHARCRPRA